MFIIYTNKNNLNGLKLLLSSLFGNKSVEIKIVELTGMLQVIASLYICAFYNLQV